MGGPRSRLRHPLGQFAECRKPSTSSAILLRFIKINKFFITVSRAAPGWAPEDRGPHTGRKEPSAASRFALWAKDEVKFSVYLEIIT